MGAKRLPSQGETGRGTAQGYPGPPGDSLRFAGRTFSLLDLSPLPLLVGRQAAVERDAEQCNGGDRGFELARHRRGSMQRSRVAFGRFVFALTEYCEREGKEEDQDRHQQYECHTLTHLDSSLHMLV